MAQIARPDSDISVGSWSPYPADPTTLFDKIDEVTPNGDTDYIGSSVDEDECEIGLGDVVDPEIGTGHKIRCYAQCPLGSGQPEQLWIALVENGNVRGQSLGTTVNRNSYVMIEYTLSEAEANAIVNYPNLRLRFHITKVNGGEPIQITQAEFECPDATEEHSGSSSISGNGSLTGVAKKGGKQSSLISAKGAIVAIGLVAMFGIASIPGGGAVAAIGQKATQADAVISGGGTIVVTGTKAEGEPHSGTASILGNGSLTGNTTKQALGDSPITGGGSVIATGEKSEGEAYSGVAVVSGNGVIDAAVIKQVLADLAITGNGVLSGAGIKQALADSTIVGGGFIVAVGIMSESHSGVAIISESGVIDGVGIKQAPGSLVIIGGGFIVTAGYGQEVLIEVVKTVFLKSKLTERVAELKSTIKRSIVLDSEINPDEGE